MSRPDKLPSWTDDDAASKVVEPGNTKKLAGFLYKERMPFQYLNWLFRHFVKWLTHVDVSVNQFDPHASFPADVFINVTAGRVNSGTTVIEKALQQIDYTALIPTTAATSRIDRIVIDNLTGVIERIAGTEAGSPTVPAITKDKTPICQILIDENTSVIESASITDERSVISDKIIILDTPEALLQTATPAIIATAINSATLNTAGAKAAIIHARLNENTTTFIGIGSSNSVTTSSLYMKLRTEVASTESFSEVTVNLDDNNDFWYISSNSSVAVLDFFLVGYYV